MAINGGKIISYLMLDTSAYARGLTGATSMAKGFAGEMGVVAGLGQAAISTAVVGLVAYTGKAAIGFESAFAGVKKTVSTTKEGYAALRQELMEIGRVVPKHHNELAGIMESAGQLGVAERNLKKFTKTIADLDVATNLKGQEGAAMLAQYANIKEMPLDQIDRLGSVIVELGNNTATTELEMTQIAQRLAGTAKIVKLTEAETFSLSATMASLGINAEAGGSAMSRVLQKMDKAGKTGGKSLKSFASVAGKTEAEFKKLFSDNALSALDAYIGGLRAIDEAGGNVYAALEKADLNDLRVSDTLLRMAGAQGALARNTELATRAWKENKALTVEAEQRYSTTESRIQLNRNRINESLIKLGNDMLPHIAGATDIMANLVEGFSNFSEGARNTITIGAGIAAGIFPAIKVARGLISLLSGPGSLIVVAGLAAAAVAHIANDAELYALQTAKKVMGDISLSASEIQEILKAGFTDPAINTEDLKETKSAAEEARKKLEELEAQLKKDVYLARFGLRTDQDLVASAKAYIEATQISLDKEGAAIRANVIAHFGGKAEKSAEIVNTVTGWISDKQAELKAAGERLSDIIIDNTFKNPEAKAEAIRRQIKFISDVQNEVAQANVSAKEEALKYKFKQQGLDKESFDAFTKSLSELKQERLNEAEERWIGTLKAIAGVKSSVTESAYKKMVDDANRQYGENIADIELKNAALLYDTVGAEQVDQARKYVEEMKKLREELQNNPEKHKEFQNSELADEMMQVRDVAWDTWKALEPTYNSIKSMKDELGGLSPEFEDILKKLELFKSFSQPGTTDETLIRQFDELFPNNTDMQRKGKENSDAYGESFSDQGVAKSKIQETLKAPNLASEYSEAARNASNAFTSTLKYSEAKAAGARFGNASIKGMREALEIRSPSRKSKRIAMYTSDGFVNYMAAETGRAARAGRNYAISAYTGMSQEAAIQKGKLEKMNGFSMNYQVSPSRRAGGGLPKLSQKDRDFYNRSQHKKASVGNASKPATDSWTPLTLPNSDYLNKLEALRQKLLGLSGSHRAYYDESTMDKELKALQGKWERLIEAEINGYEALSQVEQEKHQKQHSARLEAMQKQQNEEINALKSNYDLQKRLAYDFLQARADALSAEHEKKRRNAEVDDERKEMAALEKRIRQSRSARERRELTEELERMRRDKSLRLENEQLQSALKGLNALKNAVNKGVVGLGTLIGDTSIYTGTGIKDVQGATSEQLSLALQAIQESARTSNNQSGNHYTIDLQGATIRNEEDVRHLADEFERVIRSYGRGM